MHNNNVNVSVTQWISDFIHQLIDAVKRKCCWIHLILMRNSIAIMSACNPEIMEDILDTGDTNR